MSQKKYGKLPGPGFRLLSFIPFINSLVLIFIGKRYSRPIHIICGILYGLLSVKAPSYAVYFWIIAMVQYDVVNIKLKAELCKKNNTRTQHVSSKSKFFKDMSRYADRSGQKVPFTPIAESCHTYDGMNRQQQAWYFYWRSEVRNGNYQNTDLAYILIHVYELLSGCGWDDAGEGYKQLAALWTAYRERFPELDKYLFGWTFDFAQLHDLEYFIPDIGCQQLPRQPTIRDVLIDQHSQERPLKLPFALIESLCDYSLTGSRFYKDGHQALMQEAIPRIVALADAILLKRSNQGILAAYGPDCPRKQDHYIFQGAVCPEADRKNVVWVRAYTSKQELRSYMNELVRHGENVLRDLYGYRGRLRSVSLDEETAELVEKFLRKEYSPARKEVNDLKQKNEVKLDFESISILRTQSNAVRDALDATERN